MKIESDCDYCRYPAGGSACCGDEEPPWSCYMDDDPRMEDYEDWKPCPCFAPLIYDKYDLLGGII